MTLEKWLVYRNIFNANGSFALFQFQYPVHQQKRVPVGYDPLNILNG
jgi:hypothetical protein